MQKLYLDENISEEQLCHINFGLAKACEDLEDFEQAFNHYKKGNDLRKKDLNYDIIQDIEFFNQLKTNYPRIKKFSLSAESLTNNLMPIFIVGMPRSGTTLVEQIVSSHSRVTGAGELNYVSQFGAGLMQGITAANAETISEFRKNYLTEITKRADGRGFVTDKMPQNFTLYRLIVRPFLKLK